MQNQILKIQTQGFWAYNGWKDSKKDHTVQQISPRHRMICGRDEVAIEEFIISADISMNMQKRIMSSGILDTSQPLNNAAPSPFSHEQDNS